LSLLNELPAVEHEIPPWMRAWINRRSLRAAAAAWLRPRLQGVRVQARRQIVQAKVRGDRIALQLDRGSCVYDHVLLATGYKIDIEKLRIFPPTILRRIRCVDGAPILADAFESTLPKLHFVGPSAVASYGPLMRFLAGTRFAAQSIRQNHVTERRKNLADGMRFSHPPILMLGLGAKGRAFR
jgi:hypothetical protein